MRLYEQAKRNIIKSGQVDGIDVKVYASTYLESRIDDVAKLLKNGEGYFKDINEYNEFIDVLHGYLLEYIELNQSRLKIECMGVCKRCNDSTPRERLNEHHLCINCASEHAYCDECGNYEHADNTYIVESSDNEYYILCHDCHYDAMKRGTIKEVNGTWTDSLYIEFCKEREEECGF